MEVDPFFRNQRGPLEIIKRQEHVKDSVLGKMKKAHIFEVVKELGQLGSQSLLLRDLKSKDVSFKDWFPIYLIIYSIIIVSWPAASVSCSREPNHL